MIKCEEKEEIMTEVRCEYNFCGVTIFTYSDWDMVDEITSQFYNVEFSFESMKVYNGCLAALTTEGQLDIFDEKNNGEVWSGWIIDIPELKEALLNKR